MKNLKLIVYLTFSQKTITDFTETNIENLYNTGFVFTRQGKGEMDQTRSVRVNLAKFKLSSENRRILRKNENLKFEIIALPHPNYEWTIHKLGHDFYSKKFGNKTFSANKIKELLTDKNKSNFNLLLSFSKPKPIGFAICFQTKNILHYSYPFYDLESEMPNIGIAMMTEAIIWAQENNKKYAYLGSAKDAKALYKFQFNGVEWFDGKKWDNDIEKLKNILV